MASRRPDGEKSYLASISDLMAGVLFLFIGITVVFALNLRMKEDEAGAAREEAATAASDLRRQALGPQESRKHLLGDLEEALRKSGVAVMVDVEHGVLRLPDESVTFPTGTDQPTARSKENLAKLATILRDILPCYSSTHAHVAKCPSADSRGMLEAVFIEGHTDRHPVTNLVGFKDNWELSTARAIRTYHYLLGVSPELDQFANSRSEKLLSVSGYADSRPADNANTPSADSRNRRIDMRFIMAPPSATVPPKAAVERAAKDVR